MKVKLNLNDTYLITTNNWFIAPDGNQYKAVFGTITNVLNDETTLGIKTNRLSSNWYVKIGNMIVAGCQIFYCIKTDKCNNQPVLREIADRIDNNGDFLSGKHITSYIYFADQI